MLSVSSQQIEIDAKEVYRYLGYGTSEPDEYVAGIIRECVREVEAVSELRSFCRSFSLSCKGNPCCGDFFGSDPVAVTIGSVNIRSRALAKHLESCVRVYVFGATIGIGLDRLIARASISDMTRATIYQAVGAAYIEAYCDVINGELNRIAAAEGRGTRPRFSPGYGDFDIKYQEDIFKLLDLTKHTGISMTEGMLMTPSKSVTAIVGLTCEGAAGGGQEDGSSLTYSATKANRQGYNCDECDLIECPFRRD